MDNHADIWACLNFFAQNGHTIHDIALEKADDFSILRNTGPGLHPTGTVSTHSHATVSLCPIFRHISASSGFLQ